jgi:hypothetical protein
LALALNASCRPEGDQERQQTAEQVLAAAKARRAHVFNSKGTSAAESLATCHPSLTVCV